MAALVTKAMSLYLVTLMPTLSAAMRLSLNAMIARPERLRTRLSTMTSVIMMRIEARGEACYRVRARRALRALYDYDAVLRQAEVVYALGAVEIEYYVQAVFIVAYEQAVYDLLYYLPESQRDYGQVVAVQAQNRHADNDARHSGKNRANDDGDYKANRIRRYGALAGSWRRLSRRRL